VVSWRCSLYTFLYGLGTLILLDTVQVADYGLVEDVFNVLDRLERYCDTL
jgi:hypothetical protein